MCFPPSVCAVLNKQVTNKTFGTAPKWAQDWRQAKGKYAGRDATDFRKQPCDPQAGRVEVPVHVSGLPANRGERGVRRRTARGANKERRHVPDAVRLRLREHQRVLYSALIRNPKELKRADVPTMQ